MSDAIVFNWESEARRIATAFIIAGFPRGVGFLHRLEAQILKAGPLCPPTIEANRQKNEVVLRSYSKSQFHFPIAIHSPEKWVKWAICLGYDTAKLEADFNLTITARERLEWMLEMKRAMAEAAP